MRTELGNITIKYPESWKAKIKDLIDDVTGRKERRINWLVKELERQILEAR